MLKCIALDDEPIALDIIKAFCDKLPFVELTHCFTQASMAKKYMVSYPVDLLFLDIQMPDVNGVDFYKDIKQDVMVIFTTAFGQYAVEGFNVNAVDYLVKPIEYNRFEQACEKARDYYEFLKSSKVKNNCLYVRSEYSLVKIPFSEIVYCETMGDYVRIHQLDNTKTLALMSLTKLLAKLPKNEFARVHRSYIVSLPKVDFVRGKNIKINNIDIPIGKSYKSVFYETYNSGV